jgi:death-on-curing protein
VKAAALLHSLVRNHALVDGNERLAWAACLVFLGMNGHRVRGATEDERVEFLVSVASGELHELEKVADCLRGWSRSTLPAGSSGPSPPAARPVIISFHGR